VEADAVSNPGTVMVHLEYAGIALGAVMAPVWLCFETPLTDAHPAKLLLFNLDHLRLRFFSTTVFALETSRADNGFLRGS
jgi:hypothetical protein